MLEGGEDPRFIVRRMIILASEDIGNADPQALVVATSTAAAVEHVGLPGVHVTRSRRRRSTSRWRRSPTPPGGRWAPRGSRSASTARRCRPARCARPPIRRRPSWGAASATTTRTRHPGQVNDQEHLPEGLEDARFYEPGGMEPAMREAYERLRKARGRAL